MKAGTSHTDEARAKIGAGVSAVAEQRRVVEHYTAARLVRDLAAVGRDPETLEALAVAAERALATCPDATRGLWEKIARAAAGGRFRIGTFPAKFYVGETAKLEAELEADPAIQSLVHHLEEHDDA